MIQATKQCTKCEKIKDLSEYRHDKNSKDGHVPRCKFCDKLYSKKYYGKNKESMILKRIEYRNNNKEKENTTRRKYYSKNKEVLNEKRREYYKNNKELFADISRKSHYKHKEERNTKCKEYSKTPKGKLVITNSKHKRRFLLEQSSDGTISTRNIYPLSEELQALLERQNYECNNCRCDITDNKHLDHHIPLSKGGTHSINNVVWLCPECNLSKSNKIPKELLLI